MKNPPWKLISLCSLFIITAGYVHMENKSGVKKPAIEKPNIIYILADDLGYGEVGFNGQEKIRTTKLDKLANQGLIFNHHYAGAAVCGPSRSCLMTGKSQSVGFIKNNPGGMWQRENLPDEEVTIAEKLKEAGYTTACIGKWGLGPLGKSGYPLNQGFDEFIGYDTHVAAHNYYPQTICQNDSKVELEGNISVKKGATGNTYSHDVFTGHALEFVDREHDSPFFLYLAYTIPHSPYNPPEPGPYTNEDWKEIEKKYAAMVTQMDRDIGKILYAIEEKGIAENTLLVFSSDNGTSVPGLKRESAPGNDFFKASGSFRGIKRDLFDGGLRVPTIFWWPGKVQAGQTNHISGFQDIMPTLCDLAGVAYPEGIDGISLLPTLRGKPGEQVQHDYFYWEFCKMTKEGGSEGIQAVLDVKNQLKAIRKSRTGKIQLYNIKNDPDESEDIASDYPEKAEELGQKIDMMRGESELWPISYFD